MKKLAIFTLIGIGFLLADSDMIDTSIYDSDGFKKTTTEPQPPPKVVHNMNLVYFDIETNLMWQDEKYSSEEQGAYFRKQSFGKVGTWSHANIYCKTLEYAGYNDWRLPSLDELLKIYEHKTGFRYSEAVDFWTATPNRGDNYWSVFTADGYAHSHGRDDIQHFRCVREHHKNHDIHSASGRI